MITVATHGHCFDGLCSAVAFTHLLRTLRGPETQFEYFGAGYGPGQNGVDPQKLRGDENAILDFRFSSSPKLTWYFDHHVSAFATPEDRAAYDTYVVAHEAGRQMFHDGTYPSCTKYIADVGKRVFGVDFSGLSEMIHWADIIDSASFPSAEMAVARKEAPLKLMTVIEHHGDDAMLARMVKRLSTESLDAVASSEEVLAAFAPLEKSHGEFVELVRTHAVIHGDAVLVDLSDRILEVATKFVTYALYPEQLYSVVLTRSASKCKLSIGYNPWAPRPRTHHIASICERFGGGGHPVVGAVSFAAGELERAKKVAAEITEELSRP